MRRTFGAGILAMGTALAVGLGGASAGAGEAHAATASASESKRASAVTAKRTCRRTRKKVRNRCRYSEVPGSRRAKRRRGTGGPIAGKPDQFLPFDNGQRVRVSQGNHGLYSHFYVTTSFGWDFALRVGATVRSTGAGDVIVAAGGCPVYGFIGSKCGSGWGNSVVVRMADGSCARYAHLASINVSAGQRVNQYDVIGGVGSSGSSDGAHLHYQRETCDSGRAVPSAFHDAGQPREGDFVVSQNKTPEPAAPPQLQPAGNPQPATQNPQPPTHNPQQPPSQGGSPPPPQPGVSISKGASAAGQPGCSSAACQYVVVNFSSFGEGNHTITCRASHGDEGGYYTYTRAGTSGSSAVCYYGYPGRTVWVTVDGVASNQIVW